MKKLFTTVAGLSVAGFFVGFWAVTASAQYATNYSFAFTPNRTVPDGNLSGLKLATNLTGMVGVITNVTISLNISGGYNGDLYAYLTGPNGGIAILLNRPGLTNGDLYGGYDNSGFNITIDDSGSFNNIHFYQNVGYSLDASNALNGTWSSDGRAIDPLSDPSVFGTNQPSSFLGSLNGTDPNGKWTLFLADLSDGAQSTVVAWGLDIAVVPEPSTCGLMGTAAAIFLATRKRRRH